MSSPAKQKGYRGERYIVEKHIRMGVPCRRVLGSGSLGRHHDDLVDDVVITIKDKEVRGEVKSRKSDQGFKMIKGWLRETPVLFIKENNKEPLVVMTWELYENILT